MWPVSRIFAVEHLVVVDFLRVQVAERFPRVVSLRIPLSPYQILALAHRASTVNDMLNPVRVFLLTSAGMYFHVTFSAEFISARHVRAREFAGLDCFFGSRV